MNNKHTRREFIKTSALSSIFLFALNKGINLNSIINFFDDNEKLCKQKFSLLLNNGVGKFSIGEVIAEVGNSFMGTPYTSGTLDINMKEQLIINLSGLDCVTFVENCLVFARCVKKGKTAYEDYLSELENIRYRDGKIDGYGSRLHYFCDWIYNNQEKGIVKDITADLGGVVYNKSIDFMSTHTKSYKQLGNKAEIAAIINAEEAINSRTMYFIPVNSIAKAYDLMETGDIVATTTSIAGLDVTHTGFVYKEEEATYFMHASSKLKKVVISENQLAEYVADDSKKTGIMIARPVET
jgi:hypothetical protein